MRRTLIHFCVAALMLGVGTGFRTPADSLRLAPPGTRIISGAALRQQGATRMSDLFDLASGWTVFAIDRWQQQVRPPGTAPFQKNTWQVWVDGHLLATGGPAPTSINNMPIAAENVASVEVIDGPAWYLGIFVPYGALHVHTRPVQHGEELRADYWLGNEIGDPGPLRYRDPNSLNIDHDGPDVSITGGLHRSGLSSQATFSSRSHFPTKRAQRQRIKAWLPEFPERDMLSGALQASLRTTKGRHRLRVAGTTLPDFVFWEATAREVPLRRRRIQIGVNGRRRLSSKTRIGYRAAYSRHTLDALPAALVGVHARSQQVDVQGRWRRQGASLVSALTGRVQVLSLPHSNHNIRRVELGGQLKGGPAMNLNPRIAGAVGREDGHYYVNALVQLQHVLARRVRLNVEAAWMERPLRQQLPLAYAAVKGRPVLDTLAAPIAHRDRWSAGRTMHVGARIHWQAGPDRGLSARLFARRQRGQGVLRRRNLRYDPEERAFSGPLRLREGTGSVLGAQLRGRWSWSTLHQETSVLLQRAIAGNVAYRGEWKATPQWQLCSRWRWQAAPSFGLGAQLRGQAGTDWQRYAGAASLSEGRYQSETPAVWALDLSAQKKFWDERLRGTLTLRNVLNRTIQTHPLGTTTALMLAAKLSLRF